jgi:hypothetical protein
MSNGGGSAFRAIGFLFGRIFNNIGRNNMTFFTNLSISIVIVWHKRFTPFYIDYRGR